jgi:hypothetical protein
LYNSSSIIYNGQISTSSTVFDIKKTDGNGEINFGLLNTGTYSISAEDVTVGNVKYNVVKTVQVISGENTIINLDPTEFVGKITLNVYKRATNYAYSTTLVANVNVALLNYKDYSDTLSHSQILSKAVVTGQTNLNGNVVFDKIPANTSYVAYVYYDENKNAWSNNNYSSYIYVLQDEEKTFSIYADEVELLDLKFGISMEAYYYGYQNNSYGRYPVANTNVILVSSSDYSAYSLYSQSIDVVKSHKFLEGTTDLNGKIVFSDIPLNTEYNVFFYEADNKKAWYHSYIYSSSSELVKEYSIDLSNTAFDI